MAEANEPVDSDDSAAELRGKLIARLAIAGVLVGILLGVLAFFDHLSTAPEEDDEIVFTKPVPVAPKKSVSQPVTPAELPEPPAPVEPPAVVEAPPPPAPAVPEAKPEAVPAAAAPVASKPRTTEPRSTAAPQESVPVVSPAPRVARSLPESTGGPTRVVPAPTPSVPPATSQEPTRPSARVVETRAAPPAPSGVSRLFSGFLLQAGVFASPQRAEELHAKLTLSGVPSTLETRVQVGPFKTRQEAEVAQAKLRELGVETVLVPPKAGR